MLSLEDWRLFEKGIVWQAFLFDIAERKQYLLDLLIEGGDKDWNDDMLRGKLSELDFFVNLPGLIKASIIIESKNKITGQEELEDGRD